MSIDRRGLLGDGTSLRAERPWSGPRIRAVQQVKALANVGVELLLLFENMTDAEAMRSLRLFGAEVLPTFC